MTSTPADVDVMGFSNQRHAEERNNATVSKGGLGTRHTFALMAFLGLTISYLLRVNLSVAIVDMVNRTRIIHPTYSSLNPSDANSSSLCAVDITLADEPAREDGEFLWDGRTQGLVLGSFFWGNIAVQVPSALLAERIGAKYVFGLGVLFTGVFNILTPIAARSSFPALIAVRVLTGTADGVLFPALSCMFSRWVPESERSVLSTFVIAGLTFGTLVGMPLAGYLCDIRWDHGWPLAFYVPGAIAAVWFVFWVALVFDAPDVHPRICEQEKQYIESSTGRTKHNGTDKRLSVPWLAIFTSLPFWAIVVAQVGNTWGYFVLLTKIPTYMKTVLHFDLKSNSLLSGLPYLFKWILSIVFSVLADSLMGRKVMSLTAIRKYLTALGLIGPGCALIGILYAGCHRVAILVLLTVCIGINGAVNSGFTCNHLDIAPNHAGILMGIINSTGNICGFLAPYVVGVIVTTEGSASQWHMIFLASAAVYIVSSLFYALFASGNEQPWNRQKASGATAQSSDNQ